MFYVPCHSGLLPADNGVHIYLRRTRTAAGGGGVEPDDVANLELWLKADAIVGLNDGDAVATWEDSSPNDRDGTQATAGDRPVYKTGIVNGLPVVRFDGTANGDFLSLPNFLAGTALEVFFVAKLDADPPANGGPVVGDFGTAGQANHWPFTDSNIYEDFGTNSRKSTGNPSASLTAFHLGNMISASGEWTCNINGVQHFTTGTNTVGLSTVPKVGHSGTGGNDYYFDGDIAEIALYSRKLTTQERDDLESYFSDRYALGL